MKLIDADVLIDQLNKEADSMSEEACSIVFINPDDVYSQVMNGRANGIRDAIIEMINAPEVGSKEGYWIYLDNDELRYDSYRCSNCNRSITVDAERKDDIGFIIEDMNYCPCCGAKMVEVKS